LGGGGEEEGGETMREEDRSDIEGDGATVCVYRSRVLQSPVINTACIAGKRKALVGSGVRRKGRDGQRGG
jgi:hypothetical protein